MATIFRTGNSTLAVEISLVEQDTLDGLPANQLEDYVTLWLAERATQVFQERFAKLSDKEKGEVLLKFRSAGKETPVTPDVVVTP